MRKKTPKLVKFMEGLHEFISAYPGLRKSTEMRSGIELKAIVQSLTLAYLEKHFSKEGYKNGVEKAISAFYFKDKLADFTSGQLPVFGENEVPDFIISDPYLIAIHYQPINSRSLLQEGIGRSIVYTLSGSYDFVYYLIHDQSEDKRIRRSIDYKLEGSILADIWERYNVFMKLV